MLSDNLTVCIFAYNEEKRITYAFKNFIGKFNVLVIDNYSKDGTLEICRIHGVRYISLDNEGFVERPEIMSTVWDNIDTDYMLRALCGEYFPDELLDLYAKVANEGTYDVIYTARASITAGKHLYVWGNAKKSIKGLESPRFSKRDSIDYEGNIIHQEGKVVCEKDRILRGSKDVHLMFYQFRDYDSSWTEVKHGTYNDVNAMLLYNAGEKYSFTKMLSISLKSVLIDYFYHGTYRQGHLGFMHAYYRFHLFMSLYLRLWDIENNHRKDEISAIHNSIRERLLAKEMNVEKLFD
jgi:glycosyltransferase involved in cell wall biosynthesis